MTLRQRQSLFARLYAKLILHAYELGYEVTFGETLRPPEMVAIYVERGTGSANSLHPLKLAGDFNLFKDGRYLSSTESHRILGEYWESLHELCRWGGRFSRPDGNHYEVTRKPWR